MPVSSPTSWANIAIMTSTSTLSLHYANSSGAGAKVGGEIEGSV